MHNYPCARFTRNNIERSSSREGLQAVMDAVEGRRILCILFRGMVARADAYVCTPLHISRINALTIRMFLHWGSNLTAQYP